MLVVCLRCGATNNYPPEASGKKVVCGRCRQELAPPGTVLEPSLVEFERLLEKSRLPVLADFYSETCAPCRMMGPIVERLAGRRKEDLVVVRLNVDYHQELARQLEVRAVPTFLVFRNGYEVGRTTGAMSEMDFSLWVASKA